MFREIVVGVDEHMGSRDAIALARNLSARDGAVTLAHVYTDESQVQRGVSAADRAQVRTHALELLETAREQAGVQAHLRLCGSSSVGRGLHELCEGIDADLLVVGSSQRGLLGRVRVGDATRAALNGAPCAIAVAPAGYASEPTAMREIGVGYDGSPESDHALELARRIAVQAGAKLSAFEAISVPPTSVNAARPLSAAVDALVNEARDRIAALGNVEPHAAYGDPAEELAVYSASLDLLIVGSRGYGPIGRLIHGSTSRQLASTARCPLLVLARGARGAQRPEAAGERVARGADPC